MHLLRLTEAFRASSFAVSQYAALLIKVKNGSHRWPRVSLHLANSALPPAGLRSCHGQEDAQFTLINSGAINLLQRQVARLMN